MYISQYTDQVQLISESQSGFRKMHSTTDNIFILHSLVNLYLKKKRNGFSVPLSTLVKPSIRSIEVFFG